MLSSVHLSTSVPATAPASVATPSRVARTPQRLLGAGTLDELRELLGVVLAALYPDASVELYVAGADGRLEPVAETEAVPSLASRQLLASVRSRLALGGLALTEPHALPAMPQARRGSTLSAPLLADRGQLLGLVLVEAPFGVPEYSRLHVAVLEGIAALLAVAIQRIGAIGTDRLRARVELDRRAASRVQRRLMSDTLPPDAGVTARAEYLPALDVGGDFFELKYLGDGKVAAAIGDVSGNGVSAALLMSRVAADVERALAAGAAPSAVLAGVNDALSDAEGESFVTAACLQLDVPNRRLTVGNAGHLPLVVRRANGEVFTCGASSGTPLGMLACDYEDEELTLESGDIVLLMTDGLLEALDHPSGHHGLELLVELVQRGPHDPAAVHARIGARVDEARRRHPLDDVTWVVLHVPA